MAPYLDIPKALATEAFKSFFPHKHVQSVGGHFCNQACLTRSGQPVPCLAGLREFGSLQGQRCLLTGRGARQGLMKTSQVLLSLLPLLFLKQWQTLPKVEKTASREDNLDTKGLWSRQLYKAVSFHLCNDQESIAQLSANICMYFHTTPFLAPSHWGKWSLPYFRQWFSHESYCQNCSYPGFCQNLLLKFIVCPKTFFKTVKKV